MTGGAARREDPGGLWRDTAREPFGAPPLEESVVADLAIIGGGFTGCAAALRAAELGAQVRLLEAETIGYGGSGRNVGLVNAGLWLSPGEIAARLGAEAGGRLSAALGAAPDRVFDLIERYGIDCDAARKGTLHCAHAPSALAGLRRRAEELAALGAPVRMLSASETAARTGTGAFDAALFDPRAGVIQPLAYVRGLARAAREAGAQLHERSGARAVAREEEGWRVETAGGAVRAARLLLATNAYHRPVASEDAAAAPAPQATPVHYFQLATAPLGHNLRRSVLPGGEGAWDTAPVMASFRLDGAGRLLIGGVGDLFGPAGRLHRGWARRRLRRLFPDLADQPLEAAACGRIAMTADHLPRLRRLGPGALSVYGYSGRGIGPGAVFGAAAAEALLSGDEGVLPLTPIDQHEERLRALRAAAYEIGAAAVHGVSARRPSGRAP